MENPIAFINLNDIDIIVYIFKMFIMGLCTYYNFIHILDIKSNLNFKLILIIPLTFIIAFFHTVLKYNYFTSIIFFILSLSILYSIVTSNKIGYSILATVSSFSLNYIIYLISIFIAFLINAIIGIQNDIINLILIYIIHFVLLFSMFKLKRFKNGFTFIKKNFSNEYFDILVLNISVVILFSAIIFSHYDILLTTSLFIGFFIFAIIMFITIQKSLTLYYKHNLLVRELNDTKLELDNKNKELQKLEKENLEISKNAHSIAHKQRALEFKLNELMLNNEFANEIDIRDKLNNLSKECFNNTAKLELPKTDIGELDDMLVFLQHECLDNSIDFEVQLNGNIHHMINTFIPKEDLTILIADLVKNAIIAINHSDNINKSILVKLGLIDNYYSLYVYDSGIEFEHETLEVLGKKPVTTHSDTGGTGFGFMNTFDTLKKYNASLIINELNLPCKDNYTKYILIKFDGKNEFSINSYRLNLVSNN